MKCRACLVLVLAALSTLVARGAAEPQTVLFVAASDDRLGGQHELSLRSVDLEGETWRVGCVPCFNVFTMLAIGRRHVYALNGYSIQRAKRYSVEAGGHRSRVLPWSAELPSGLLPEAELAPGCKISFGGRSPIDATSDALVSGVCLGTR